MKGKQTQDSKPANQGQPKAVKPEIRDNLDSRKNEEFDFKGDDITHNKKDHRNNKQRKKE